MRGQVSSTRDSQGRSVRVRPASAEPSTGCVASRRRRLLLPADEQVFAYVRALPGEASTPSADR